MQSGSSNNAAFYRAAKPDRLLGGALLTGVVSIWLFYAKWPVERDKILAETLKIAEDTAQTKLAQQLTKAQTQLNETQDKLAQLDIETKQIDRKYAETLKQIQTDNAINQGKLIELQRRQAEITTKTLPAREDSAVTRESIEAANAITNAIQSIAPRITVQTQAERIIIQTKNQYGMPVSVPTNKALVASQVSNIGTYPFNLSVYIEFFDANGNDIPGGITYRVEGPSTPSGTIQPGQTLTGSTTMVFPEDWVKTKPGVATIKATYHCQTPPDIVDSLAKQIHVPGIRDRLIEKQPCILVNANLMDENPTPNSAAATGGADRSATARSGDSSVIPGSGDKNPVPLWKRGWIRVVAVCTDLLTVGGLMEIPNTMMN